MTKRENAYFTVEAALVFPMVLAAMMMIVYLFLFQYNRCLLEQDISLLALYAVTTEASDEEASLQNRIGEIYLDKYVLWKMREQDISVALKGGAAQAQGVGGMNLPLPGVALFAGEKTEYVQYECTLTRTEPVAVMRLSKKIRGGD